MSFSMHGEDVDGAASGDDHETPASAWPRTSALRRFTAVGVEAAPDAHVGVFSPTRPADDGAWPAADEDGVTPGAAGSTWVTPPGEPVTVHEFLTPSSPRKYRPLPEFPHSEFRGVKHTLFVPEDDTLAEFLTLLTTKFPFVRDVGKQVLRYSTFWDMPFAGLESSVLDNASTTWGIPLFESPDSGEVHVAVVRAPGTIPRLPRVLLYSVSGDEQPRWGTVSLGSFIRSVHEEMMLAVREGDEAPILGLVEVSVVDVARVAREGVVNLDELVYIADMQQSVSQFARAIGVTMEQLSPPARMEEARATELQARAESRQLVREHEAEAAALQRRQPTTSAAAAALRRVLTRGGARRPDEVIVAARRAGSVTAAVPATVRAGGYYADNADAPIGHVFHMSESKPRARLHVYVSVDATAHWLAPVQDVGQLAMWHAHQADKEAAAAATPWRRMLLFPQRPAGMGGGSRCR